MSVVGIGILLCVGSWPWPNSITTMICGGPAFVCCCSCPDVVDMDVLHACHQQVLMT